MIEEEIKTSYDLNTYDKFIINNYINFNIYNMIF